MNTLLNRKRHIAVFVLPSLLLFFAIGILPLFVTAGYSLFEYDGLSKMNFIGLLNYIKMFAEDKDFHHAIGNSAVLIIASVFIQLPLSFVMAHILAAGVWGEKTFRTIYFIPVVISSMVIGRLWMSVFHSQYGLLNELITFITGKPFHFAWMTEPSTAFLTTVVPAVWQYIGYHMLILYAGIKSIPADCYEAASIDGAKGWVLVTKITLPMLAPVLKTCVVFAIVGSIKAFDLIYIITGGGPNKVSHVPATLMYENLFKRGVYGYGSAQAFFIVIACFLISGLVNRLFRNQVNRIS